MPYVSKYPTDRQQHLIDSVTELFEQDKTPADLALMTLGNIATEVLYQQVPAKNRKQVAEQFTRILLQSIEAEQK